MQRSAGPHVFVFQVYPSAVPQVSTTSPTSLSQATSSSLLPTTITLTSSISTPQLVASMLGSTSSALPSLCNASNVLASPIFPARVTSPSLAPALQAMAVPVQRQASSIFPSGIFPHTPPAQAPSRGPYAGLRFLRSLSTSSSSGRLNRAKR